MTGQHVLVAQRAEDLGPLLLQLEQQLERLGWAVHHREAIPYRWEVKNPRLLPGLREASRRSLAAEHRWNSAQIESFLDRWIAGSCPMQVYLTCLSPAALQAIVANFSCIRSPDND